MAGMLDSDPGSPDSKDYMLNYHGWVPKSRLPQPRAGSKPTAAFPPAEPGPQTRLKLGFHLEEWGKVLQGLYRSPVMEGISLFTVSKEGPSSQKGGGRLLEVAACWGPRLQKLLGTAFIMPLYLPYCLWQAY